MTRYKRPVKETVDPYKAAPLPVERPAAVYYRQSTEAQIGNIPTTLQTVGLIEHLLKLGWIRENIYMIDMDAGISGAKTIEERPGMSMLYDLIEKNTIGLVAAQDVDRFFRDLTMIQTNIFLDACKRKNVQVMTPNMVYDFNHPTMGAYFMKLFRDDAQRAADFLEYLYWKSTWYCLSSTLLMRLGVHLNFTPESICYIKILDKSINLF